jgi:small-conductance mechanosensitive channel
MYRLADFIAIVLKLVKFFLILIIVYALLPLGFSIFPSTEDIALKLIGYVLDPIKAFGRALVDYIPQLIAIIVIILIARGFIRLFKYLSNEIRQERLQIDGFYPEWAHPTYNLLKVFIIAFAFVSIFPLIPGSGSDVFKGVSVFFGLLISLGSSSAIGNIIAGLVITYMRPFQIGDRVRIGDATGDVIEKTLLVTRLRTIKNEDVTIPNSSILTGNTFNFSSNAKENGLILNASVTIGYDVPWRKVHAMLIEAAERTGELLKEPKPFVLQTGLDDFYVNYQINCYTEKAEISASIYSELYGHIQDVFAEHGVEILSPHYRAGRDGTATTIPELAEKKPEAGSE